MARTSRFFLFSLITLYLLQFGVEHAPEVVPDVIRESVAELTAAWRNFHYLATLDPDRFIRNGCDTNDPRFSPLRLGRAPGTFDDTREYDFARLEAVRADLADVDRRQALWQLFSQVTAGAANDTERHRRVLSFLQKALRHEALQPLHRDGVAEYDPLVLLELAEARCGQVARVAVDLFEAAGYAGRLVQAHAHVLAEIRYRDRWHYLDADMFGGGDTVVGRDGVIPSVAELARTPYALDALSHNWKMRAGNRMAVGWGAYPSYFYFARRAYTTAAVAYRKRGDLTGAALAEHFGWNSWITEPYEDRFPVEPVPCFEEAAAPQLDALEMGPGRAVALGWGGTPQPRSVSGYRVLVSRTSRGWSYDGASTADALLPYKSHPEGCEPDDYDARLAVPHAEVLALTTVAPRVRFDLPCAGEYYVSVMALDAHGLAVGRTLFPVSEELKLNVPAEPAAPGPVRQMARR